MARTALRLRAREADSAGSEENNDQGLDEHTEVDQPLRSGPVTEGDDEFLPSLARRAGWRPKEEWDRDPSKWKDERAYLADLPDQLAASRERVRLADERARRNAQATADALEAANRDKLAKARSNLETAAKADDPERVVAAAQEVSRAAEEVANSTGPHRETVDWVARNPWFDADPEANAMAVAVVNRAAKAGATIAEQLQAAETAVKKRFPEHFGASERERQQEDTRYEPERDARPRVRDREVPLSESRIAREPPAVSSGSRAGAGATKEKGFNDIPAADRSLYQSKLARKYEGRGMTPDEARNRYAKTYWREQGETK